MKNRFSLAALFVLALVGISTLTFLSLEDTNGANAKAASAQAEPLSAARKAEAEITKVNAITFEDTVPYLEALLTFQEDGLPHACVNNNLAALPAIDASILATTNLALNLYLDQGFLIRQYIHVPMAERVVGASPWGSLNNPELGEKMAPFLEKAKQLIVKQIAQPQPIAQQTN